VATKLVCLTASSLAAFAGRRLYSVVVGTPAKIPGKGIYLLVDGVVIQELTPNTHYIMGPDKAIENIEEDWTLI
jgi:hypothetical protein